jgi:hypothetical protein
VEEAVPDAVMRISYRTESDMARGIYSRGQYTRFSFNEYDVGQWETEGYVRALSSIEDGDGKL